MTLNEFNNLSKEEAEKKLNNCCGASNWRNKLMKKFPFSDEATLLQNAGNIWYNECNEADWLEAFSHHPKIGDINLKETRHLAGEEQAGVNKTSPEIMQELVKGNREYEARFGFIFIVSATGRSADEMLRLLKDRLKNNLREELRIAMGEQYKITILRLQKILNKTNWQDKTSQLTTHVLDTSGGNPGNDITIRLKDFKNGIWETFAQGVTNADGRINDLLPAGRTLDRANYKMVFETGNYFISHKVKSFYPEVEIQFTVYDDRHYHVPLLINPFGYSTYRGS